VTEVPLAADFRAEIDELDSAIVGGDPSVALFLFEPANRSAPPYLEQMGRRISESASHVIPREKVGTRPQAEP
jgi:hypothetical protein